MPMTGRCRELNCHAVVVRPLHYCAKHADKEAEYQASRERWKDKIILLKIFNTTPPTKRIGRPHT